MDGDRFVDDGRVLSDFTDPVLIVCPRCSSSASVRPRLSAELPGSAAAAWNAPRRLVCPSCALTREWAKGTVTLGAPVDPYLGLPLLLQTRCNGELLWAYNSEHVAHVREYVEAAVRQRSRRNEHGARPPMTVLERLPGWMTTARHRKDVLAALDRLATMVEDAA